MRVSAEQEAQFECFMGISRLPGRVVLSLLDDAVLLNCGARQLSPAEQRALESAALRCAPWEHHSVVELMLDTGTTATARAYTSNNGVGFPGVVLEVLSFDPPARRGGGPFERLAGESAAWRQLCSEALRAAEARDPVLLVGEPGTGKLAMAEAMIDTTGMHGLQVFDMRAMGHDVPSLVEGLRQVIRRESTAVVLRHLECCNGFASLLAAELEHSAAHAWVLGTLNGVGDEACREILLDRFWRIRVPSLDERREDIPALLAYFAGRHGDTVTVAFQPEALEALKLARFAENIRDLERLVERLLAVGGTGREIRLSDLPPLVGVA